MKYPIVFLIPALMLLDYFLTVAGRQQYQRYYGQHVHLEQYEMNPVWQQSVAQDRWLNRRHIFMVVFITTLLIGLSSGTGDSFRDYFVFGALVTVYLLIIGRHLSNILNFRYCANHPDTLNGEVHINYQASLKASQFQVLGILLPFAFAAGIVKSPFLYGGVTGLVMLTAVHYLWLWRYQRHKKANPTSQNAAPEK